MNVMLMSLNGMKERFHQDDLKSENTYEIFLLMQLTKNVTNILSVYLKKCMKEILIRRYYQSSQVSLLPS